MSALPDAALDQLWRTARTHSAWQDRPVPEAVLQQLYALVKMGPTSANCSPARFIFVTTPAGRDRLRPYLDRGNIAKTMSAPVTVIIGYDTQFYDLLPRLFPHTDARAWFAGNDALIEATAFRNSSLQGAYLILAARALGLDCGPMSGFAAEGLAAEFFPAGGIRVNFLCNLGYGDAAQLHPRSPRLEFADACQVV